MINNICSINRITPIQGFVRALPYRRALPHVNDHRALPYANDDGFSTHILKKAESLLINSVGQRPTFNNEQYNNKRKKLNIK